MKFEGTSKAKNWMKNNRVREKCKFSEIYLAETYFFYKVLPDARSGDKNE